MNSLRAWKGYFYALLCVAGLIVLIGTSESFQKCEHERKNNEPYKALHEEVSLSIKSITRLKLHLACARLTASENDGAIAALSGIAVAAFTLALWIATDRLWRAGEKQMRAATKAADAALLSARITINVERPFVYISDLELASAPAPPQLEGIEHPDFYTMVFIFTNYGRTPAFITKVGYGFSVGTDPPPVPAYQFVDDLTVEVVIRPGKPLRFDVPYALLSVAPEQKEDFANGLIFPWLWGCIQFRDFLDGTGEIGFIAFRYPEVRVGGRVMQDAAFRFRGPAAYTYQRYSQSDGRTEPRGST